VIDGFVYGKEWGMTATEKMKVLNISGYRFFKFDHAEEVRAPLRDKCRALGLRGTVLLSPEGINCFLAGERSGIEEVRSLMIDELKIPEFEFKESFTEYQPFTRMLVKVKKNIIPLGPDGKIKPYEITGPEIEPSELKKWYDEQKDFIVIDTRNDYEVKVGTFENAVDPNIKHFREFEQKLDEFPPEWKEKDVVIFCTGGIRCEKASPLMIEKGFKNVHQLKGGILKYFELVGGDHWNGECFVFDQRVGVGPDLRETKTTQCYHCRAVVDEEAQRSQKYVKGVSCPACFGKEVDPSKAISQHDKRQVAHARMNQK